MQKTKILKENLKEVIVNLETQREYIQSMINDVETRIKKNKEAGNVATMENLSPTQKEEVQRLIKEQLTTSEDISSQHPLTTAKKLMPKMRDKV